MPKIGYKRRVKLRRKMREAAKPPAPRGDAPVGDGLPHPSDLPPDTAFLKKFFVPTEQRRAVIYKTASCGATTLPGILYQDPAFRRRIFAGFWQGSEGHYVA